MRRKKCFFAKKRIDYFPYGMLMPNRKGNATEYRYGYQGSEKDNEIKGEGNHYTTYYRQLDPRIGKWFSMDPKPSASWSSYASMNANPIWFNDVLGDTIYRFKPDGSLFDKFDDGRKDVTGLFFQKSTEKINQDLTITTTYSDPVSFTFNDIDLDRKAIGSGKMKAILIKPSDISDAMNFNGVRTSEAQNGPWKYIERESRPSGNESILSGQSSGKLDHFSTSPVVTFEALHIVQKSFGGRAKGYNDKDFGNFLWGHAGKQLGFSLLTLRTAAQINNAVNGDDDNGVDVPLLDDPRDQKAIQDGFEFK